MSFMCSIYMLNFDDGFALKGSSVEMKTSEWNLNATFGKRNKVWLWEGGGGND
jgi:hypothetical protein